MVSRPHMFHGICQGKETAFLLGEAAGFISPSSFEGISYALASGEALAKSFRESKTKKDVQKKYRCKTARLKLKVQIKCVKHPFMFQKLLRALVLKSGIGAIPIKKE